MPTELEYQIALTITPHIGCVAAKTLVHHFGNATAIYKAKVSTLSTIDGIGSVRAASIKSFADFSLCEQEISFVKKQEQNIFVKTFHFQ